MGITADWTSRSWVLRNTADLIPLLQIWNTQYAQHSIASPKLQTFDFERLYTNIHTADMQQQIMDLVHQIFGLPAHSGHVGIKVWETQPAIWLKANKMPAHAMLIFKTILQDWSKDTVSQRQQKNTVSQLQVLQ